MKRKQAYRAGLCPFEPKRTCLLLALLLFALLPSTRAQESEGSENYTIRGRVLSAVDDLPLPGVAVRLKSSPVGVNTDENGYFVLTATDSKVGIRASYLGYRTLDTSLTLPLRDPLIIRLRRESFMLEGTVVKGYYTTTNALNTGNVTTVVARDIESQPVGDPIAALAGRVPGLLIRQSRGVPGRELRVQLRGINSLANGTDPLYVVDGVPFPSERLSDNFGGLTGYMSPFNTLNPADIESITVLKDADATAIYGSMGANGVILITTKRGSSGPTRVDANFSMGWGSVTGKLDLLNTQQYLDMRREAFRNDEREISGADYDVNGVWDPTRYTDWQDVFIGGTSTLTNGQVRISGGNKQTRFTVGGGYRRESTVYPGDYFDRKLSLQARVNHVSANDRLDVNFSFSYVNNDNRMPEQDFTSYIVLAPNAPALFNENGELNWENETWDNPFAMLNRRNRVASNNYLGNWSVGYKIVPGLTLRGSFGFNHLQVDQNMFQPLSSLPPSERNRSELRLNRFMNRSLFSWIAEPQLNYEKRLFKGTLEVLAGMTFRETKQNMLFQMASNFADDALIENIQAAAEVTVPTYANSQYRYNAVYGRIGYNWAGRYVVNLTGRRDGSSRFGPGRQFGNFGAAGMAWIFSREKFLESLSSVLSFGKLRGSYGITGNDQLADYEYLSTYSSINFVYLTNAGLVPSRLHNPDFGWESVKKLEAALELGFLNDRIRLTTSWYRNRTGNQLVGYPLPQMTGFSSIQANLPAIVENKGFEFELSANLGNRHGLTWSASANISFPRNKLVEYPGFENSTYRRTYQVGKSMFGSYRYQYKGIDPETGLFIFNDLNGDGSYTLNDDRVYMETERKFHGGFSNRFSWKGLELAFHFQFAEGVADKFLYYFGPGRFNANQPATVLDRWQQPGETGHLAQRYSTRSLSSRGTFEYSDGILGDASYLRLKNLALSWSIPKTLFPAGTFQQLRVYVQGQNLWTLTNYEGIDPESASSILLLPPIRMFTAGVQLTL